MNFKECSIDGICMHMSDNELIPNDSEMRPKNEQIENFLEVILYLLQILPLQRL